MRALCDFRLLFPFSCSVVLASRFFLYCWRCRILLVCVLLFLPIVFYPLSSLGVLCSIDGLLIHTVCIINFKNLKSSWDQLSKKNKPNPYVLTLVATNPTPTVYMNCSPVISNLYLAIPQIRCYLQNIWIFPLYQQFVNRTFWFIPNWVCLLFLMRCFRCFRSSKRQEDSILCLSVSLQLLKYSATPPPYCGFESYPH